MRILKDSSRMPSEEESFIKLCCTLDGLSIFFFSSHIFILLLKFIYSVLIAGVLPLVTHKLIFTMFKDNLINTELSFFIAAIYTLVDSFICCSINLSLDSMPVIFMSYAIAMLNQLSQRLEKIGEDQNVKANDPRYLKELIDCVKLHIKIKDLTQNIEKHFSVIILIQGLMSSIIFCTIMYNLSMVEKISQVGVIFSYLTPMVLQIFMPCYFGQMLCDAFDRLNTSLYRSAWFVKDEKFKLSMKIVMENFNKRVNISTFGVFDVDLQTFTRIVNTAFSLYAVLESF